MSTTKSAAARHAASEFHHAISFVRRVKDRYYSQGRPTIYDEFLEILGSYQRKNLPIQHVHDLLVTLLYNEPDLIHDFQQFLPNSVAAANGVDKDHDRKRERDRDETYLDARKLDGLSSVVFIANATISQDETDGKFERVLQGLQGYFEMLGTKRSALRDINEDLPPAEDRAANIESPDQIASYVEAAEIPSVSQDHSGTNSEGSTAGIDNYSDNDDSEMDDEFGSNEISRIDNDHLDKTSENDIEEKNNYGGTRSQNSDIDDEDGPQKNSNDMFFPTRGIRGSSAFASDISNEKFGRKFSFRDEHSLIPEDQHCSGTQEPLDQEDSVPRHKQTKRSAKIYMPDSGNEGTKLRTAQFDISGSREELVERLQRLGNLNDWLLSENRRLLASTPPTSQFLRLYRVHCPYNQDQMIYLDPPINGTDKRHQHLEGYITITNLKSYLETQPHFPFLVFKDYECEYRDPKRSTKVSEENQKNVHPAILRESFRILSTDLCSALKTMIASEPRERFPVFDTINEIASPYLFYYHNRTFFKDYEEEVTETLKVVKELLHYIQESVGQEYNEVDAMLALGKITAQHLPYLFASTKVVVTSKNGQMQAYTQTSMIEGHPISERDLTKVTWLLDAESWVFDGSFQKSTCRLQVSYENDTAESIDIKDLKVYPLVFAPPGTEVLLRSRGEKFWSCREQKYVSYTGQSWKQEELFTNMRFMIDISAYHKMHPKAQRMLGNSEEKDKLPDEDMKKDQPPEGDFLLLLPSNVFGFHMQEKRWVNLQIDCIRDVDWNEESFKSLVIDSDTKELIIALVTNKLEAERATDLMAGKGSGLIILLHGGPGTGKTLTAESVAEIAKKPLYRVTCGDIDTNPANVEKYLETVLNLGKMWKCVVLLDEADVFLEQRTLQDLQRNALVSVFLRVLEYYDGILILTSNRVATFDEAFKSRIQLALHYKNLNESQRKKIWQNFIAKLEGMEGENVDTENLYRHVKELAKLDMNGREIRNALTTARQLAMYKRQKMDMVHMKHVINVAGRFESYLHDVSGGVTDDEVAREMGYR